MRSRARSAIWLAVLGGAVLLPLAAAMRGALAGPDDGLTLSNLTEVWGAALTWRLLARGLLVSAGAAALAVTLGVPYAYLAASTDLPGRGAWEILGICGIVIPSYPVIMSWLNVSGDSTWVRTFLAEGMALRGGAAGAMGYLGVIWILGVSYVPFVVLFSAAAFRLTDEEAVEAARADGASGRQVFAKIRLPAAMTGVALGAGAVFALALGNYEIPAALGLETISWEVLTLWTNGRTAQALAMAAGPTLVVVALYALYAVGCGRSMALALSAERGRERPERLGGWSWPAVCFCGLFVAATLGVPLAGLLTSVGGPGTFLRNVAAVTGHLGTTLVAACGAALLAGVVGLAAGGMIARTAGPARAAAVFLAALPMAVPAAVLGLGLHAVLNRPVLYDVAGSGSVGLALGAAVRFLPFAVFAGFVAARSVPTDLEDAARVDGAGWGAVAVRVCLPLTLPATVAGVLIVFALSVSELQVTNILCPPGYQTLAVHLADRLHTGGLRCWRRGRRPRRSRSAGAARDRCGAPSG